MPKVSVIVPVYNAEKYIQTTIDSIRSQFFLDWELILVDDCSKDNTSAICQEIARGDNRIVYIKQEENGGPSKARNTGLNQATGEFVAFVDSDDTIEPTFLKEMVDVAIMHNSDIVWCNYKEFLENNIKYCTHNLPAQVLIPYDIYIQLFFNNHNGVGCLWNKLYRRSFLDKNKIRLNTERVHGEDWEFNLNCFKLHPVLVTVDKFLYNYIRQNSSSVMATYHAADYFNLVRKFQMLDDLSKEEKISYDKVAVNNRFIYNVIEPLKNYCFIIRNSSFHIHLI